MMEPTPTTEDRIWAVLSHLSVLTLGIGIVLPIIGWSDQRRKSKYASFQSLQAVGYQSLGYSIWVLSSLLVIVLAAIVLLAVPGSVEGSNQAVAVLFAPWMIIFVIVVFGLFLLYLALPIIGAMACAFGRDFRYPVMGDRLARYLEYSTARTGTEPSTLNEDKENRWVAAMGHFSILILIWGMLAPLITWLLQGRESLFLKFQSIQALVYQAAATTIFSIGGFLYLVGFFLLLTLMGGIGESGLLPSMGIVSTIVSGVSLLISLLLLLLVPWLHILGQWAGFRVLKGDDYRYPIVGRLVDTWLSKKNTIKEKPA